MCVSENLWIFLKDVKPLDVCNMEQGLAIKPMQRKCATSCVDLVYTNLLCTPEGTSVFFSSCDSDFGDSPEFHQGNRGSLRV